MADVCFLDPLADIPECESDEPRGAAADAVFVVPSAIEPDECDALADLFGMFEESGLVECLNHSHRINGVYLGGCPTWEAMKPGIYVPDGTGKLPCRLSTMIQSHNLDHWKLDIVPFPAPCMSPEVTLDWQGASGDGVPWHSDYTVSQGGNDGGFEPKLVAIVQLSDPADYDGGEFEIYSGTQIVRPQLDRGDMILFPSFLLHRRRPITRGRRFILMAQAWGPRWR